MRGWLFHQRDQDPRQRHPQRGDPQEPNSAHQQRSRGMEFHRREKRKELRLHLP